MSLLSKIALNEYNPFTHVFTNIIEPLEKLDDAFRQEFTFNIYQRALDVVFYQNTVNTS